MADEPLASGASPDRGGGRPGPPTGEPRRVLLVGSLDSVLAVAPVLARSELEIETVASGERAVEELARRDFHVLVVREPRESEPTSRWWEGIGPLSPSSFLGMVVLHEGDGPLDGLPDDPSFPTVAVPLGREGQIVEAVSGILGLEPRHTARLEVELVVRLGDGETRLSCLTRNVSRTGLLVQTASPPRVGLTLGFELELPGGEGIAGEAEIVRHRQDPEGRASYAGMRFLAFEDDGFGRWRRFLARLREAASRS